MREEGAKGRTGFLARSPRGLEWVSAAEVKGRLGAKVTGVGHREVHFELPAVDPDVLHLSTVDDVFMDCGSVRGIDHTRASLQVLAKAAREIDFAQALAQLRGVRPVRCPGRFDVVASFLGRRNYNRFEVERAVGEAVSERVGAVQQPHGERAGTDVSWRVHLRDLEAYIGLRISPTPLHRRGYKGAARGGTLHPPVAAAMALLAGIRPCGVFLDPFCGVGTIPVEAARFDPELIAVASDIDPWAVSLARENAGRAGARVGFAVADAGRLPFGYRAFDRVVCNLPWRRTVEQKGLLLFDTAPFWGEVNRLLHSEGRAVVLSEAGEPTDDQMRRAGLSLVLRHRVRVSGRWSTLSVLVPDSNRDPTPVDAFGRFGEALLEALENDQYHLCT
jgi:23S rRNA G2445 N2-methylase RlmL